MAVRQKQTSLAKNYVVVINNYTVDKHGVLAAVSPHCNYCCFGHETAPTTGTPHIQGFISLKKQQRMKAVQSLFPEPVALQVARGTASQNRSYIFDPQPDKVVDPAPVEAGVCKNAGHRSDLEDAVVSLTQGANMRTMIDEHPAVSLKYLGNMQRIRSLAYKPVRTVELDVRLYVGPTGTGKSRAAFEEFPQAWWLPLMNKDLWFDGYDDQPVVVLDDFAGQLPLTQLLRLLDRYPLQVPVKGSFTWWCPNVIIVTTNFWPDEWYDYKGRHEHLLALRRRFTTVKDFKLDPPIDGQ